MGPSPILSIIHPQRRIQDFQEGGANPPVGGANIRFYQIFQKLDEFEKILGRRGAPPYICQ